jgi:Rha family phage regulatory protein
MTKELVFLSQENNVVTDSLTVAKTFGKNHDKVLRDIRELGCSDKFRLANFGESSYINSQNKEMPKFYMNKKAFTMLVMGYTGPKAMEFKEAYIEQFEEMEEFIRNSQQKQYSEREQLNAVMRLSQLQEEDLKQIKTDVDTLKKDVQERLTIDYGQQLSVDNAKKKRIEFLWNEGHINTEIFDTKRKVYGAVGKELKFAFGVSSYRDIKQKDFEEAINFLKGWRPRSIV